MAGRVALPRLRRDHASEFVIKAWTFECGACRRQTSVTARTVMRGSKLPLTVRFWAASLMTTPLSRHGPGRFAGGWAWGLLCAKLRRVVNPNRALLSGVVEIDETQIPCVSAWNKGSDSILMNLGRCLALVSQRNQRDAASPPSLGPRPARLRGDELRL